MAIKNVGSWPVNELGEIVAQAGIGTTTVTGFAGPDQIPTDPATNKVVIKLPNLEATVLAENLTGFVSGAGSVTAADTILTAFNKLNGNDALKASASNSVLTGVTSTQAVIRNTVVVTAAGVYAVVATDDIIVINKTSGAATVVNLPAGVLGRTLVIKDGKGDANTNNITLTPAAGNIDGSATYIMNIARQATTLAYSGTEWVII